MSTSPLTPSVDNIVAVYRSANAEQVQAGLDWYAEAYAEATRMSLIYGVSIDVAAGVIAALSPLNSWGANVRLAERFIAAGGLTSGYLSVGLTKAARILAGEDAASVLTSDKVGAFFECIRTSGESDKVCVDRHAFDLAVNVRHTEGTRPSLSKGRYRAVADAYRAAALVLHVSPAQVQAVTWVTWRRRYWGEGAFDLKNSN